MENIIILFTPIMFQSAMKRSGSQDIQMIFSAVIERDNFFGTQFHPEKSGLPGEKLLESFINL